MAVSRTWVSDNGRKFRAMSLPDYVESRFIKPGQLVVERTNRELFGRLRDELLSSEIFRSGPDLQSTLCAFQDRYHNRKPSLAPGNSTAARFKAEFAIQSDEEILRSKDGYEMGTVQGLAPRGIVILHAGPFPLDIYPHG